MLIVYLIQSWLVWLVMSEQGFSSWTQRVFNISVTECTAGLLFLQNTVNLFSLLAWHKLVGLSHTVRSHLVLRKTLLHRKCFSLMWTSCSCLDDIQLQTWKQTTPKTTLVLTVPVVRWYSPKRRHLSLMFAFYEAAARVAAAQRRHISDDKMLGWVMWG